MTRLDRPVETSGTDARSPQCRPILLLDVDGVIAPFGAGPDDGDRWTQVRGGRWQGSIWCHLDVTERLATWHHGGHVQLRWLTTWLDDAKDVLAGPLGFGELMVHVHPSPDPEPEMWWKESVVRNLLDDPGHLVVWCDDQMIRQDPYTGVDTHRGDVLAVEFGSRFLAICPDPIAGLQPQHLDEIADFMARGAGGCHS
jgi:hypothetical protein